MNLPPSGADMLRRPTDSEDRLLQILFQLELVFDQRFVCQCRLEQALKDTQNPKMRKDLERSIRGTKLVLSRLKGR